MHDQPHLLPSSRRGVNKSSPSFRQWRSALMAVALASAVGCAEEQSDTPPDMTADQSVSARTLSTALPWLPAVRARLNQVIASYGATSGTYDVAHRPVAVFDWDNTVLKNDIGDAVLFWMIRTGRILQPPQKNWRLTSPYLTVEAAAALDKACGPLAAAGSPLPTATDVPCATELVTLYTKAKTVDGKAGFAGWNYRRMEPTYAWAAQLQAGYTAAESQEFARQALEEGLAAKQGAVQKIGSVDGLTAWVRIYEQQKDLIANLKASGFEVWVVSASPEPWVIAAAARVDIAADHVVGIRMRSEQGKLTSNLQGCGDIPDGENDGAGVFKGNSLITYIDGKRCFINKVIYGDGSALALQRNADAKKRPVLAAGDSDTDVTFLQDATAVKLVMNRHKKEVMCNALQSLGGKWLLHPMFIEPSPMPGLSYKCSVDACKDASGAAAPCRDEDGAVIPDQSEPVTTDLPQ